MRERVLQENEKPQESSLTLWLKEEGIRTEEGLRYMGGSEEQYIEILRLFVEDAGEKMEKLSGLLAESDMKEYGILVHAVKTNARSIGADRLADMAFELEKAAKAGDAAFVTAHHEEFKTEWMLLTAGLKFVPQLGFVDQMIEQLTAQNDENAAEEKAEQNSGGEEEKPDTAILEKLTNIADLLDNFEIDLAKQQLNLLEGEEYPDSVKKCAVQAVKAVSDFDYEEAISILHDYVQKYC